MEELPPVLEALFLLEPRPPLAAVGVAEFFADAVEEVELIDCLFLEEAPEGPNGVGEDAVIEAAPEVEDVADFPERLPFDAEGVAALVVRPSKALLVLPG